jgi:hypothetical protein
MSDVSANWFPKGSNNLNEYDPAHSWIAMPKFTLFLSMCPITSESLYGVLPVSRHCFDEISNNDLFLAFSLGRNLMPYSLLISGIHKRTFRSSAENSSNSHK